MSLRVRLLLAVGGVALVALAIADVVTYQELRSFLYQPHRPVTRQSLPVEHGLRQPTAVRTGPAGGSCPPRKAGWNGRFGKLWKRARPPRLRTPPASTPATGPSVSCDGSRGLAQRRVHELHRRHVRRGAQRGSNVGAVPLRPAAAGHRRTAGPPVLPARITGFGPDSCRLRACRRATSRRRRSRVRSRTGCGLRSSARGPLPGASW